MSVAVPESILTYKVNWQSLKLKLCHHFSNYDPATRNPKA